MKKIVGLILSLTIIAAVCAGVLAYVNILTLEPIEKATAEKTVKAAKEVMPSGVVTVEKSSLGFLGKDSKGDIIGYAVEGKDSGGYGGDIILMVGFNADKTTVVCYKKLIANETPGLGSKLDSPEFSSQFYNRSAKDLKVKKDGGEIDAITAATITSRAVCKAIENAREKLAGL